MPATYILPLADAQATLATAGGKGASLAQLAAANLPVPDGFHITTAAYREFVAANHLQPAILNALQSVDTAQPQTLATAAQTIAARFHQAKTPPAIAEAIARAYARLPGDNPAVAVRSSATAEDLPQASFAGQQETFLNVRGEAAVLAAVKQCWASLWTDRAISYRLRQEIAPTEVALAVVVQLLVPAEAAGVLFTANPVNGRRDQAMISAAWGLGEAIVGGLVTPDNLIVDKATGHVHSRETAAKQVMTVRHENGTKEKPVPEALCHTAVLSDQQAARLVHLGTQIEELYGMPMDVEWTLATDEFAIVQARPITALPPEAPLPEPEPPPPQVWKLPSGQYIAMRNNIVELMIEPLTPLFSTLGLRAVNASMKRLMADFFGRPGMMPDEPILPVNQYAYYNGSLTAGQMGRIFLGSVGIAKRMFTGAVARWTEVGRPRYLATVQRRQAEPWPDFSNTAILAVVRELGEAAIEAYGALVSGVIPAAWISEGLFTFVYNVLLKRRDDAAAATYLKGFDSVPIRAEKSLYDLAEWVQGRAGLATYLLDTPTPQLVAQLEDDQPPPDVEAEAWHTWQSRFQAHLQQYGHTIYNLDFANPVPADDPAPLLEMCKLFIRGQGANPYERQQAAAARRQQATQTMDKRLGPLRRRLFHKFLAPAQRYAPLREDGLADVGLSYPLLRQMLHEVGRRFVAAGVIENPDDIYWLQQTEVETAAAGLDRGETPPDLASLVPQRKAAWRAARRATPPRMLPHVRFPDMGLGKLRKARAGKEVILKGVAAGSGRITAPACVLHGPQEFAQMKTGDVLVAAITTPAWTPLFARAAAVVTDIGGPLSHGSIVAREYGIPAVLGTGTATKRIRTGDQVCVDGERGTVRLVNKKEGNNAE